MRRVLLASCADLPAWEVDDRPLHAALAAAGFEVSVAPWTAVDPATLPPDTVVWIRTTWDYHQQRDRFVAWCAAVGARCRLFNPPAVVAWNTDKTYLRALADEGIPSPETVWLGAAPPPMAALLAERGWSRGFLKPVVGANAVRTFRFGPDEVDAADAFLKEALREGPMMAQPYLERVESDGEFSAIFVEGALAHGVQKIPKRGDWRVQDDHGAADQPHHPGPAERAFCEAALAAAARRCPGHPAGPLLYARVDYLLDSAGQPRLIELELVEPSLFFRHGPATAHRLAAALCARIDGPPGG